MTYKAWSWAIASVMTRRGFATKLRTGFDATLAECPYKDLTGEQWSALFKASRSLGHRFCVWLNWRVYDLRRLTGALSSAVNGTPWWPG